MATRVLLPGFEVHRNHTFADAMDVPFLLTRLAAKITVKAMLSRNGFRDRMARDQAISLHELLVPLLQGWDSVMVKADVEVGGSDQLFNFQVARTLQQAEGQKPQACLMTPVIRGTDGRKMSKSFGNTVWLDTSPADMFGQVMSIPDDVMHEWRGLLTDLPESQAHPMAQKLELAHDIVRQLHGSEAATAAQAHFKRTVQGRQGPDISGSLEAAPLVLLVAQARDTSKSKARNLIVGGGVRINGEKVLDLDAVPEPGDVLQVGKRLAFEIS